VAKGHTVKSMQEMKKVILFGFRLTAPLFLRGEKIFRHENTKSDMAVQTD
jgi:hypothetical protein